MSTQFGKCNLDGRPVEPQELEPVRPMLSPYGPDAEGIFCEDNIGIIYRAFHTTKESRLESQPLISRSGVIITWDGRLDNRSELIHDFPSQLSSNSTDVNIVATAYERWGAKAFAKLIGDWALSIWNPRTKSLFLAKDFVGTRHLYYTVENDRIAWCTILGPLVLLAGRKLKLSEEYIAGWLSHFPATHLTPYSEIRSVPPACFVELKSRRQTVTEYWHPDPHKLIRYAKDVEYEEHFRTVLAESIRRRLRADTPILAELSGGMDSSSIVCIADTLIAAGRTTVSQLSTVSYYNQSEPNWNEFPYFSRIEEKRRQTGCHIDLNWQIPPRFDVQNNHFAATPSCSAQSSAVIAQFIACLNAKGHRVLLSGIGGDEILGGIPTPLPELASLFVQAKFLTLGNQLVAWSLAQRKSAPRLLFNALQAFLPTFLVGLPEHMRPPSWLQLEFVRRQRGALTGYASRQKLFGPQPSFQDSEATLNLLRRQLGCSELSSEPPYEKRYPYLDRDLFEFACAVPPEQLTRPGQRRSLMRRALVGIVPDEILQRKRKAFIDREPLARIKSSWQPLAELVQHSLADYLQIVDSRALFSVLLEARDGKLNAAPQLMRTLAVEAWLRHAKDWNVIDDLSQSAVPLPCAAAMGPPLGGLRRSLSAEKSQ